MHILAWSCNDIKCRKPFYLIHHILKWQRKQHIVLSKWKRNAPRVIVTGCGQIMNDTVIWLWTTMKLYSASWIRKLSRQQPDLINWEIYAYDNSDIIEYVTLAAIPGTSNLVACHFVKSLQLIWRSSTRRFHLRVPDLQMSCSDLISKWDTRIIVMAPWQLALLK